MDEFQSNVVTLHVDRSGSTREAMESLRLLKAFMQLPAARRTDVVDALEREALTLLRPDRR